MAEELVKLFSRVGIPREILTDQGSNFTSKLLAEMYRLLHIKALRTSPYHPQCDGLVERFNKTLKEMLRKTAKEEGKDWDKLLPYLDRMQQWLLHGFVSTTTRDKQSGGRAVQFNTQEDQTIIILHECTKLLISL